MARDPSNNVTRGEQLTVHINGAEIRAHSGETVATVLLAQGIRIFNRTTAGEARGPYCNMGCCFECQVKTASNNVSEFRWVRACMTQVREGMSILTGEILGGPFELPFDTNADDTQANDNDDHN